MSQGEDHVEFEFNCTDVLTLYELCVEAGATSKRRRRMSPALCEVTGKLENIIMAALRSSMAEKNKVATHHDTDPPKSIDQDRRDAIFPSERDCECDEAFDPGSLV